MDAPAGLTDADLMGAPSGAPMPAPTAQPAPHTPALPVWSSDDNAAIARAALAEGDATPESWRSVAGVIRNRMAATGQNAYGVISAPNQFEAFGNGHIAGIDPSSPQYQAALAAVTGVKAGDVPYNAFYSPGIVAARGHGTPPFDPKSGTMVGSQLFGVAGSVGQPMPAGLTADEQRQWEALQPQAPTTEAGKMPGPGTSALGQNGQPLTAAQERFWNTQAPKEGWDTSTDPSGGYLFAGTEKLPYFLQPGSPLPQRPGAVYVDFDGVKHVVPGDLGQQAKYYGQSAFQGLILDPIASASRLTGGGIAVDDPLASAISQTQGGPGAFDLARGAQQGFARQQQEYASTHGADPYAGAVRTAGQLAPATALAAAVPEISLPGAGATGARGLLSSVASKAVTNALRGVAGTAPTVATSPAPVGQQLATGAAAGVIVPPVLSAAGKAGVTAAGLNAIETSPEVRALADKAINDYGIPLRASQLGAASGDRALGVKDSNLISAAGSGFGKNNMEQQRAFTRAAASTLGGDETTLTPEAMDAARQRIGAKFDVAAQKTGVAADDQLISDLAQVGSQARELGLDPAQREALDIHIGKIADLVARNRDTGVIPGDAYQALTRQDSTLSKVIRGPNGAFSDLASDIRSALNDAVARASPPEERANLTQARFEWKNLKTLQPLAEKAGPDGLISPRLLLSRVASQFPDFAYGGGDKLGDLARIGKAFMTEPSQSGTAPRAAEIIQRNRIPLAISTPGAVAAAFQHPEMTAEFLAGGLAAKGASMGINALQGLQYGPGAARRLLNGPGAFGNALGFINRTTAPVQVPLSALGAHFAFPGYSPVGAQPQEAH